MSQVLWVVGEPGVGKTTLCRLLLATYGAQTDIWKRPKWTVFGGRAAAAGHWYTGRFDGADTIPPGDLKSAVGAWSELLAPNMNLTLFDGDKLSNPWVVEAVQQSQPKASLICVSLEAAPAVAEARRVSRGTIQNPTWVAGRRTKAGKFATNFPGKLVRIAADRSPAELLVELQKALI